METLSTEITEKTELIINYIYFAGNNFTFMIYMEVRGEIYIAKK